MSEVGRREFIGAAATAAGVTILKPSIVFGSQANSAVRLGVLGCGGRGTTVASSFIKNTSAVVTAIGDIFQDNLENGKQKFDAASAAAGKPGTIEAARMFKGPKAYEQLFTSKDIDAIYIATPPYFHPGHLEAAIASGKHIYLEKPVAVDVPGARHVMALGEKAKGKVSLAVGFQIRHATPYVELAKRVHEGQIGAPVCGQIHYFASALDRPDWPNASPAERRLRNWVHDRILSGDIIVEQDIHIIDVTNWLLQGHPVKAVGSGGRAGRTDKGDAWSHFNCVFTYPNDVAVTFGATQFGKAAWGVGMQYYGTKGCAEARYDQPVRISGETKWDFPLGKVEAVDQNAAQTGAFRGALDDADPNKQKAFVESITSGKLINEATQGAESALAGMLGRTAAYTGHEVTWEQLMASKEVYDPKMDIMQFAK
jgi:myo-inositol 2-dehydrogenase / D-chiro-inositol 1-dehydrogenase